jgi:hypothetical protein
MAQLIEWVTADNNTPLSYNPSLPAANPVPVVFNNELYLTWQEHNSDSKYQVRVKKWNGTTWVSADSNTSLNYNPSLPAANPVPVVFNNELYLTWQEYNSGSVYQIRVKKWNGATWVSADNNTPLNYNPSLNAAGPVPVVFNNELYLTWQEYNSGTNNQIRVKKLKGDILLLEGSLTNESVHKENSELAGTFSSNEKPFQYSVTVNGTERLPLSTSSTHTTFNLAILNSWLRVGENQIDVYMVNDTGLEATQSFVITKTNLAPFATFSIDPASITRGDVVLKGVISNLVGGYYKDDSWTGEGEVFIKPITEVE